MKIDDEIKQGQSIRLMDRDYSPAGTYFVSICSHGRECLFGGTSDGEIRLNEYGKIVEREWMRTSIVRPNIQLAEFTIMPNHFHGIIDIAGEPALRSGSIGPIIGQFKSAVTKQINMLRSAPGAPVWQRNYYERVIRDEDELDRIRQYVINNPFQWEL